MGSTDMSLPPPILKVQADKNDRYLGPSENHYRPPFRYNLKSVMSLPISFCTEMFMIIIAAMHLVSNLEAFYFLFALLFWQYVILYSN